MSTQEILRRFHNVASDPEGQLKSISLPGRK